MDLLQILLLAIVQGVTEFLPVSSSGHLIVANAPLPEKLPDIVGVEIALHLGTLASIIVYYWRRIWRLLFEDRRVIGLMIIGTLPAVAVGLPLHKFGKEILQCPLLAGLMFPVTAAMLALTALTFWMGWTMMTMEEETEDASEAVQPVP